MPSDTAESSQNKREPFSNKLKMFNALLNILKFPPPKN